MTEKHPANRLSLLADIGGTNTRVALAEGTRLMPETLRRYRNADHDGIGAVIARFLADEGGVDCTGVCVAAAGPVHDGVAQMTNLDWIIDRETLRRATKAETAAVLNDLQAQGHALGHIPQSAVRTITAGNPAPVAATRLVIGLGTGFNAAAVFETPAGRFVPPAEFGHTTLPILDEDDLDLARFLQRNGDFPAKEEVLSGRGLEAVYRWLSQRNGEARQKGAAEIMEALGSGSDPLAQETCRVFVRALGRSVGDLALDHLPYGGIFLVGGVARAVAPYLEVHGFSAAMTDKGRFGPFLRDFPVFVVDDDYAALTGCAHHLAGQAQ